MCRRFCIAVGVVFALAIPALGQIQSEDNTLPSAEIAPPGCYLILDETGKEIARTCDLCTLVRPGQVERFAVTCPAGVTTLDAFIADCCIPGDHWQLKVKIWDNNPNTAVATSPGPVPISSTSARTYPYGTTVNALAECSYLHGVNVFPAASFIAFPGCTVTSLGVTDEISRTP